MEKDVRKIIKNLAETAQTATVEARDFMQEKSKSATEVVSEKTAGMRYGIELSRIRAEQNVHFAEIGRMAFLVKTGAVKADEPFDETEKTPQQTMDAHMILAEQAQQQIDALNEKIEAAKPAKEEKNVCPDCGYEYKDGDVFCRKCGAKL